jgi:Rps23 Pro-64 3,4-dihydroxylase Tpa1-like proline 4-hydroxylase
MNQLAARPDADRLAESYRRNGYVQIPSVLNQDSAETLHQLLRSRGDWKQVLTTEQGFAELDRGTRAAMPAEQLQALDEAVYARARSGFQYRYESIRVPDGKREREASGDPLAKLAQELSSDPFLRVLQQVTGSSDIAFADAQATAFSPGDFLTGHDDAVEGKNRQAAYVLNLTPTWRIEWGGLLLFHGDDGNVSHGLVPTFNTLNIFTVPGLHSVSEVTRAAPYRRYSVTGWLRTGVQP